MPLARILTFLPEDATPLFQQLQRLGFQVEVANPNEQQLAPADLEIEFAICDQQQVLARAAAIAAQLQAEVIVFPGALPPLPKPAPIEASVSASAPPETVTLPQQHGRVPVHEPQFELQPQSESWFTNIGVKLRKVGGQVATGCSKLAKNVHNRVQRLKPVAGSGLAKLKTRVSSTGNAVANRTREYQERLKLRSAEAQVAREKRLAEMERARAEAREQVAALERARLAAEAEHQRSLQQQHPEPAAQQRRLKVLHPPSLQLRGVLTGAAAASILFIVGMLLANFHPTNPLPNMTNSSVQQARPFGATTVHGPPGVTVGGAKTTKAAPVAKTAPPAVPQLKPQPAKATPPATKKKSQWHRFRQRSNRAEDDVTADDVVVRHYTTQQKPVAKKTQQQAGLKRYSDQ